MNISFLFSRDIHLNSMQEVNLNFLTDNFFFHFIIKNRNTNSRTLAFCKIFDIKVFFTLVFFIVHGCNVLENFV